MKFVLIPDSFKGTLSSQRVCEILSKKICEILPDSKIISLPVADGGEGTVDCFLSALNGQKILTDCSNAYGNKFPNYYGGLNDFAVIEVASTSGLPLIENNKNPLKTTTLGLGEQIKNAIDKGYKKIIIGLGGSSTNDFGCGMAYALGVKFLNKDKKEFLPTGGNLLEIADIDLSKTEYLKNIEFIAMCDVENPPFGKMGAANVFAPQKGATQQDVLILDNGVKHLCELINNKYNIDLSTLKGGGAAGALGAGVKFFLNAQLKSGINTILETLNFEEQISDADFIITGEGKTDSQSVNGKVLSGVGKIAKSQNIPVIAIVGGADGDMTDLYNLGITSVFPINRLPQDFSISKYNSENNLSQTAEDVLRLINCIKKNK